MRGPVNTRFKLKIVRKGQDIRSDVTADARQYSVRSVRARMEGDDIAYIRITTFNEQTPKVEAGNRYEGTQIGDKLKGSSSTCATIPAACWKKQSRFPTPSSAGEIVSTRGRNARKPKRAFAHPGDLTKGKR